MKEENQENPFLLFMSYTHKFSICPPANASKLAFSAAHIENSLTA